MLALAYINEEDCEGHIPEALMTPLIIVSKAIAISGRLLAVLASGEKGIIPEVDSCQVQNLLQLKDLKYARPPVNILISAEVMSREKRQLVTNCKAWFVGPDRFVPAAQFKNLTYNLAPKQVILRALRSPLAQREICAGK